MDSIDLSALSEAVRIVARARDACTCEECNAWARDYIRKTRDAYQRVRGLLALCPPVTPGVGTLDLNADPTKTHRGWKT